VPQADLAMAQTMMPNTTAASMAGAMTSDPPAVTGPAAPTPPLDSMNGAMAPAHPAVTDPQTPPHEGTNRRAQPPTGFARMKRFALIWVLLVAALALVGFISVKACSNSRKATSAAKTRRLKNKRAKTKRKKRHRSPSIIRRIRSIF